MTEYKLINFGFEGICLGLLTSPCDVVNSAVAVYVTFSTCGAKISLHHTAEGITIPMDPDFVADKGFARVQPCSTTRFIARNEFLCASRV
jgi:hypothetical protein